MSQAGSTGMNLGGEPVQQGPPPRQLTPPQAAVPIYNISSKITLAAIPGYFDGDKKKWKSWWSSVKIYMTAYAQEFGTDVQRILFICSLLRNENETQCTASDWLENWKETNRQGGILYINETLEEFLGKLTRSFADANDAQEAQIRIISFTQGKKPFTEWMQQFKLLAEKAGYKPHEAENIYSSFLISLLENLVNREITAPIYSGTEAVSTDYQTFRNRLETIAGNLQRKKL
jgi:hypothetical protein